MTEPLYHRQPRLAKAEARVVAHPPDGGLVLDVPLFYPTGGGQPGDSGWLDWAGGRILIATTRKGEGGTPVLLPEGEATLPPIGAPVVQHLDWDRRHRHMRMHTALHLLSVVIPLPVTGGQIGAGKGRLDFLMPEPPSDIAAIEARLNALIARDLPVRAEWIDEAALDADPGLVKTLSVAPPRGAGWIRLIRIGGDPAVDLQPCGGTHVARTAEIGPVAIGKVESKGRQNRRVAIHFV